MIPVYLSNILTCISSISSPIFSTAFPMEIVCLTPLMSLTTAMKLFSFTSLGPISTRIGTPCETKKNWLLVMNIGLLYFRLWLEPVRVRYFQSCFPGWFALILFGFITITTPNKSSFHPYKCIVVLCIMDNQLSKQIINIRINTKVHEPVMAMVITYVHSLQNSNCCLANSLVTTVA